MRRLQSRFHQLTHRIRFICRLSRRERVRCSCSSRSSCPVRNGGSAAPAGAAPLGLFHRFAATRKIRWVGERSIRAGEFRNGYLGQDRSSGSDGFTPDGVQATGLRRHGNSVGAGRVLEQVKRSTARVSAASRQVGHLPFQVTQTGPSVQKASFVRGQMERYPRQGSCPTKFPTTT